MKLYEPLDPPEGIKLGTGNNSISLIKEDNDTYTLNYCIDYITPLGYSDGFAAGVHEMTSGYPIEFDASMPIKF